jgi:hypothetical protein
VPGAAKVLGGTRATLSTLLNERAHFFAGDGVTRREGIWRVHEHPHADAE